MEGEGKQKEGQEQCETEREGARESLKKNEKVSGKWKEKLINVHELSLHWTKIEKGSKAVVGLGIFNFNIKIEFTFASML